MKITLTLFAFLLSASFFFINAQTVQDSSLLSIDRIFASHEFMPQWQRPVRWVQGGEAYLTIESSKNIPGAMELVQYESKTGNRSIFLTADKLIPEGKERPVYIENFSMSDDESKVLIFTNSSRVWRSNTKGDYYIYNFDDGTLKKIGARFPSSSLMFAKFSADNKFVAYVHDFNIYKENFETGKIKQLTFDGNGDIINGTFDWVYEEEFGCRDGFRWSNDAKNIAFWQLDASDIPTFYMINNTDSVYSKIIPVQYPKVGFEPSACKVGIIDTNDGKIKWILVPGNEKENYIPAIQWLDSSRLLIQQLNRKQNKLKIFIYNIASEKLNDIYTETEETWVDLSYPDVSASHWGDNDLAVVDDGKAFLRLTENDGWRHIYKVDLTTGDKKLITPGEYDVASVTRVTKKSVCFIASPQNTAQRYLYSVGLKGKGDTVRITLGNFQGINLYNISPNGKYAIQSYGNVLDPGEVHFVSLPKHKELFTLIDNKEYKKKLAKLKLPEVEFFKVVTAEGVTVDGRMIKPVGFDKNRKYPVLFHVYGEPWGQVATDNFIGLWNIMLAQKGYIIIDMDNRGTPCLKGSEWRKIIYRQIGRINSRDQAMAALEVLKWSFIDKERTAVWGWSGGGSMTLNLMFRYPDIYKTGMAVAAVANQLTYDNIYQERYMGLSQENMKDFIEGSPISYAKNLEGNLLVVHGTGDDNVHYQNAEMLINELIRYNKQFSIMPYPNRSHGIYEGRNTRRHLYTLLTNYLNEHSK